MRLNYDKLINQNHNKHAIHNYISSSYILPNMCIKPVRVLQDCANNSKKNYYLKYSLEIYDSRASTLSLSAKKIIILSAIIEHVLLWNIWLLFVGIYLLCVYFSYASDR